MLFLISKLLVLLQLTLYMDYSFVRAKGCDTCCVKQCLPVCISASIKRYLTYVRSFKNYYICICYFSTKHTALRSKSKDWVVRNHYVFDRREVLLFQYVGLVQSRHRHHLI